MIETFIKESLHQPWQPGKIDCLLALADWCVWRGHSGPAPHLRGMYDDDVGFRAIIERAGGAVPLVGRCADRIGLIRTEVPAMGDIAVIGSEANIQRQWGAIWDGGSWRVRFVNDYPPVKARALAIWSV